MGFGKEKDKVYGMCLLCSEPVFKSMVVLEDGKVLHADCAKKIAGAIGYSKIVSDAATVEIRASGHVCDDKREKKAEGLMRPKEIKAQLDRFVVGQEEAKKVLSVAVYNHYKRHAIRDVTIQKSNVLLIGPTGAGKTYLIKTLARIVDVPLAIVSATNLTEAGYIGDDVSSILEALLSAAGGDIDRAEKGIVFIDEIDKLAVTSSASKSQVGGKGVQQALLPVIEGSKVMVPLGKRDGGKVEVDTSNILFVCGGAFPDIGEIVKKRLMKDVKPSIGFGASFNDRTVEEEDILLKVINDDLKEFGFIPEFLGRLPILTALRELSVDTLKRILFEPEDSIVGQFQALFEFDGVSLVFDEEALTVIAKKAKDAGTGARSLRKTMEDLLLELQYEIPGADFKKVVITRGFAEGKEVPVLLN